MQRNCLQYEYFTILNSASHPYLSSLTWRRLLLFSSLSHSLSAFLLHKYILSNQIFSHTLFHALKFFITHKFYIIQKVCLQPKQNFNLAYLVAFVLLLFSTSHILSNPSSFDSLSYSVHPADWGDNSCMLT